MGCIILPLFVKKRETFSPWSASSAISSAVGGLGGSTVFGIEFLFFFCGLPERDQMIKLTHIILTNFKYERVQVLLYPTNGAILLWLIGSLVEVIWTVENNLCLFKPDAASRIFSQQLALARVKMKTH